MTDPQAAGARARKILDVIGRHEGKGYLAQRASSGPWLRGALHVTAHDVLVLAAALTREQQAYELAIRSSHPTEVAEAIIASVRDALAASTAGQKPR